MMDGYVTSQNQAGPVYVYSPYFLHMQNASWGAGGVRQVRKKADLLRFGQAGSF